jgi:hypothetical protein
MPPYNQYQRRDYLSSHDKPVRSPVTPAVTGIEYPSVDDASTDIESRAPRGHGGGQQFYTLPNIAASSIDDAAEPPSNASSLDQVWNSIRQQKERRMAKEKPKVQSLEEVTQELLLADQTPPMPIPVIESQSSVPKSLKKHKSMFVLHAFCERLEAHNYFFHTAVIYENRLMAVQLLRPLSFPSRCQSRTYMSASNGTSSS